MQITVKANNIDIYVETFGDRTHPAVLLIMGLSCQCLNWFPYFYEPIVEQGYYVIRFDNRDVGLSTWSDANNWETNPYSLDNLATDSVELLQALGIDKAHVIGASMGGAIAQRIAINYPEQVLSLTSIVSFADASALSKSNISSLSFFAKVPSLEEYLGFWSALAGITYPLDIPLYTQLYKDSVDNSKRYNPDCITHQLRAIARSPTPDLALINVPTLILSGTADPLIPATHAVEYAKLIADSQLIEMDGVGHDIPAGICDRIHPEIFKLLKRSNLLCITKPLL
ncbi:MAG: alpha/beta hydrolase [Tatlockia sp.]|nr:alpha/beta hydrolase [Tatlockia sp.]